MRFSCVSFLFLLFLLQNELVKMSVISESRVPWTNKDNINAFMHCFCQNIAKSPVFSRQEKEHAKSVMEMLVSRLRNSRYENNNIQSQTMKTDFSLAIAKDATNLPDASVKTDELSQILTFCFQFTFGVDSKQFHSETKDIIRMFVEEAKVSKEVRKVEKHILSVEPGILPVESDILPVVKDILPVETDILPVETDILPVVSGILPVEPGILPVESDILPVESDILPVVKDILPVETDILHAISIVTTEFGIVVSQNQSTDDSLNTITPSTTSSPSSAVDSSAKGHSLEKGYNSFIFNNKKSRSIRQKRESITIGDQDLENCATSAKLNLANKSKMLESCSKIFNRGIWDEKSDETLDTDIRKLMHLLYDGKRENIMNVLYFINNYVPQNVRELIVSYDAIIYEFEKYEDFNENINQLYFLKIQNEIKNIKNMKSEHPAENYNLARQVHKDMLENLLENLNAVSAKESIRIVYQDIKNCANAVKYSLVNQSKVLVSCRKIFNRGFWDEKADKTLDDDIRNLILLIYESKRENIMFVLRFIREYVPKSVRELIVSYDAFIYEFENNDNFAIPVNFPDFQQIKEDVTAIRGMNSPNHQAEHYSFARQVHKDMLDNMVENLLAITERESVTIRDQDIYNCANSVKFDLATQSKVLASCRKIFFRGFWDDKADKTLDGDIRMLIQLLFDDNRINIVRVLLFIEFFVPQNVRELIVSYDAIIDEFEKNDDFNLPINQPYFLQVKDQVSLIKEMKVKLPVANYDFALQVYKDMLDNMLENLNAVSEKQSVTIRDQDIQNCANSVKSSLVNQTLVLASCRKMFNRGFWDKKADKTFDGDTRKLIQLIYDGKRENLILVLNFIYEYVPNYVREHIVSYDAIINEFEKNDDFNLPVNYPHFWKIRRNVRNIKEMNKDHPAGNYNLARQIHKDMLENMLENLNAIVERKSVTIEYEDIQNCANSVKLNVVNESEIFVSCRKIFNRGFADEKVDKTLDRDIKKLIQLCYDSGRENLFEVIYFIDEYVPKYVRELIVSCDALVTELEKTEDFAKPVNEPYVLTLYFAIKNIKNMNGESPAEKYELARQTHKDMLENILKKFSAIKVNNSLTKESVIQNCIEAIQEEASNAESLCNKILKEEKNREWHASDVPWSESDVEQIVLGAYNSDRENFEMVLEFVLDAFPYIEQTAKGYQVLLDEMEKNQPLAQDELKEFIENVRESFYVVDNSAAIKVVLSDLLNNLNIRFETLKEKVIQTCIKAIKGDDIVEAELKCKQILKKEDNREWVSGVDYYPADVEKIVRGAYDDDLGNVDNVLKFIRDGFPYSTQDVLGYSTLLDELEKNKKINLEILNKLLEKVKSSMMVFSILADDVKHEFEMLENRSALLIKDKEEEVFQVLIKGLQADRFTTEENTLWKKFYGGVNDYKTDWLTYGYVEKLIVRIYGGISSNFDITLKAVNRFYFADQMIVSFETLLREMDKFKQVHEESLKVLQNKVKDISVDDLSEEYKNKVKELRDRLNILLDVKKETEKTLIQDCIELVQSQNWFQAEFKCNKIFIFQSVEIPSNEIIPESDDLKLIVTTIYASNLENTDHVLKFIDILPYIHQRLRSYSILLNEVIKKKDDYLYFSALNPFKEKIKEIIHSNRFQFFSNEHKDRFKKLRKDLKEMTAKFMTEYNSYISPKRSLEHENETIINVESISMKIIIHYDLPSYFSEYSFENELKILHKESEECIKDYKDFVLPQGWMSHVTEPQVNIWVFNDMDIFGNRDGFINYNSGFDGFSYFDGMFLYRKKEDNCRVQHFKHEFMHILFVGGLGKFDFSSSVPPWFHDGLSELAEHGPCSTRQLNLLKKRINDNVFRKQRNIFMGMICLRAEQQMKEYPSQWILQYFLSYFNVLYLRIRHPQFLQQIIHDAQQRGWEGSETKSASTTSTASARKKLCDLFNNERELFFSWLENSAESQSFCYSDQPNGKFKLAYGSDTPKGDGQVSSLSIVSDGKLSWENLISAFVKEDSELIDKEIELYCAALKKQIESLNLLPLSEALKQQKSFMDTVLRFMNEIYSRRVDISIGYYYYYADIFLKLVFEDIVIPSYQRACLVKEQTSVLKAQIQSAFNEFLQKAFSKDQPPDHRAFLSWYRSRCHDVDFCTSDDLDKTENMLKSLIGDVDYAGVSVPDKGDRSNDTEHFSF